MTSRLLNHLHTLSIFPFLKKIMLLNSASRIHESEVKLFNLSLWCEWSLIHGFNLILHLHKFLSSKFGIILIFFLCLHHQLLPRTQNLFLLYFISDLLQFHFFLLDCALLCRPLRFRFH